MYLYQRDDHNNSISNAETVGFSINSSISGNDEAIQ